MEGRRSYKIFGCSPGSIRANALMVAEPISFSMDNQKALSKPGKRNPDSEECHRIIEFISGVDAQHEFDVRDRGMLGMGMKAPCPGVLVFGCLAQFVVGWFTNCRTYSIF